MAVLWVSIRCLEGVSRLSGYKFKTSNFDQKPKINLKMEFLYGVAPTCSTFVVELMDLVLLHL